MDKNKDGVRQKEYQVIQEQIVPKKKSRWKRWGRAALRTILLALLFGFVAGVAFVLSGKVLAEKLGLEQNWRQIVGIGNTTPTPKNVPTKGPTKTPTPIPTKTPTKIPITPEGPSPSGTITKTPEVTPEITVTVEPGQELSGENTEDGKTIQEFLRI